MTHFQINCTSDQYRLHREERITIGTRIYNHFVDAIRKKLIDGANSTFRPIFNICNDSWNGSNVELHSNNVVNRQYFAIIRDYWVKNLNPFTTQQIDLTINGSWNFKLINVRFVNASIIIDGLRIENVSGSIKLIDDSNEILRLNYNMSYFLLIVNHTDRNIRVQVSAPSEHFIVSVTPNFPLSAQNTSYFIRKLQSTVASYIEQSIYSM